METDRTGAGALENLATKAEVAALDGKMDTILSQLQVLIAGQQSTTNDR